MPTEVWLAATSVMLTVIGTMFVLGYRDISRRLLKLEKQDSKLFSAVLAVLIAKANDPNALANALHGLISDGIEKNP